MAEGRGTDAALVRERLDAVLGRSRPLGGEAAARRGLTAEDLDPDDLDPDDLDEDDRDERDLDDDDLDERERGEVGPHGGGRGRHGRGARRGSSRPLADPDLAEGMGLWPSLRDALADRVPVSVRRARWAVPLPAVTAALLVAAVVVVALAVRSSATAPGLPVPVRSAAASSAPAVPVAAATGAAAGTPAPPSPGEAPGAAPVAPVTPPVPAVPAAGSAPSPPAEVVVHVAGRVAAPGVVRLPPGARVVDALEAAGGAAPEADLAQVNLARPVVDGEQVLVPAPGEEVAPAPATPSTPSAAGAGAAAGPAAATGSAGAAGAAGAVLDLNTATAADLDALPGIGPVLAQRILDTRAELGSFTSVEELGEVSGIGEARLADLRELVAV